VLSPTCHESAPSWTHIAEEQASIHKTRTPARARHSMNRVRLRHAVRQFVCGCVRSTCEASRAAKPISGRVLVMDDSSTVPRSV
jgi:hypothetical protein